MKSDGFNVCMIRGGSPKSIAVAQFNRFTSSYDIILDQPSRSEIAGLRLLLGIFCCLCCQIKLRRWFEVEVNGRVRHSLIRSFRQECLVISIGPRM